MHTITKFFIIFLCLIFGFSGGASAAVTLASNEYPAQTKAVFDVLGSVGGAIDATIDYVDEKTGNVVSKNWNELDESTKNQIKGGAIIAEILIPASSISALKQFKVATKAEKAANKVEKVADTTNDIVKGAEKAEKTATKTTLNEDEKYFHAIVSFYEKNGKLPNNFITKEKAKSLGWNPKKGNLDIVAPGKSIGGDVFKNSEKLLPESPTRTWYEADINYTKGFRNSERLIYSSDGLIYKTSDHYKTFTRIK